MVATVPPPTTEEPPANGEAPRCALHPDRSVVWTSPAGYHCCQECKDTLDDLFPQYDNTLATLLKKELEPIRWTVEGMIPEGLTFLAGKPKLGKSWLALVLALSIASENKFLTYRTVSGSVLYIALEDSERRIQERAIWLGARTMSNLERFHYRTEWPALDHGGLDQLETWMLDYPETRLIVVDTFGRLRGDVAGRDRYAEEYTLLGGLQKFAIQHGIALVCVHHLRKQAADDWLEGLSGSQAVTGAADTILGLYRDRGQMDATLRTVSRDVDEFEMALKFNLGRWEFMGPAEEYRHTVERVAVLAALRDLGGEAKVADIAALVDKSPANTSKLLIKLTTEGAVQKSKYGHYKAVEVVEIHHELALHAPVEVVEPLISPLPTSTTSTTSTTPHDQRETSSFDEEDFEPDLADLPEEDQ